jgi:hypothetical protein
MKQVPGEAKSDWVRAATGEAGRGRRCRLEAEGGGVRI